MKILTASAALAALIAATVTPAFAADTQSTEQRLDDLTQQVEQLKKEATAPEIATMKFRFSATTVANYTSSDQPLMGQTKNSFMGGAFLPVFLARYKDVAEFESHLEVSNNGMETETSLEYAQIDLFLSDRVTLVAGKFLSPIGQFQQALHPPWVNKLPDRPAGFEEGEAEPVSDVGVQLRGAWPMGDTGSVNYAVFMTNGPQLTDDDGLSLEGSSVDNNNNKALGGRLGVRPQGDVSVGVSFMHADVPATDAGGMALSDKASYSLTGADFSYTPRHWDLRGEIIDSKLGSTQFFGTPVAESKWKLWYLQAGYSFGKLMPVVRMSRYDQKDGALDIADDNRETRETVGLDYWFGPTVVGKVALEHRDFKDPARNDERRYRLQLVYAF